LFPKTYLACVTDIDVDWLRRKGFRGVLFDLDNTIIRRDTHEFSREILEFIEKLRGHGFAMGIVSNSRTGRVDELVRRLNIPAVGRAAKPFGHTFRNALKMLGTTPAETVIVGDQIFTDVLGGNLAGLHTILVTPMPGKDFIGTKLISRPLERLVLARFKKHAGVDYGKLN